MNFSLLNPQLSDSNPIVIYAKWVFLIEVGFMSWIMHISIHSYLGQGDASIYSFSDLF